MARGRYGDGLSWRVCQAERRAAEDLLAFQLRAATLKLATARLLRLLRKANFDPNQPRIPRGDFGGGRWTDGGLGTGRSPKRPTGEPVRLAQGRGIRPSAQTIRLPNGLVELSPLQSLRYQVARRQADTEVARVRAIPGSENWRPPDGFYSSVEGLIRHQEAVAEAAIAYRFGQRAVTNSSPSRGGIGHNSGDPRPLPDKPIRSRLPGDTEVFVPGTLRTFAPNDVPLGVRYGRAGENIYTLDQAAFNRLLTDVLRGSALVPEDRTPASYVDKGYWIELADRCIVGLRWSTNNGPTIEVIRSSNKTIIKNATKFHRGEE